MVINLGIYHLMIYSYIKVLRLLGRTTPSILQAYKLDKMGCQIFLICRIPVQIQLNPERWKYHLTDYWGKQLPDLIEFAFPLDFDRNGGVTS